MQKATTRCRVFRVEHQSSCVFASAGAVPGSQSWGVCVPAKLAGVLNGSEGEHVRFLAGKVVVSCMC